MHELPTGPAVYGLAGCACLAAGGLAYIGFLITVTAEAIRRRRGDQQMSEQPALFPDPSHRPTAVPDRPLTAAGAAVRVRRACNGCGNLLGDATDAEIEACVTGRPLPDVRDQCPTCTTC
jgi:hypothetical protein